MTEAPKKIYVDTVVRIEAGEYGKPSTTEYIRADIVDRLVKVVEAMEDKDITDREFNDLRQSIMTEYYSL